MTPKQSYREIPLTRGKVAIVDAVDYEWLSRFKWHAHLGRGSWSAYRCTQLADGKRFVVLMHREIMGLKYKDGKTVDHINPALTLDNRRANLRIATASQQVYNRRKQKNNSSGFKGVHEKRPGFFEARIQVNGKTIYLGSSRVSAEKAFELYAAAAPIYHGEFARLA